MALAETRGKLKATLDELKALIGKEDINQEDVERIKALKETGQTLKAQLDLLGEAVSWDAEMSKSAGMLSLAGNGRAEVLGMTPAGVATVESKAGKLLVDDDGNPMIDAAQWKVISNPEYRQAFKAYLRRGIEGMRASDGLKVLQEGIDTSGGYLVPDDLLSRLIAREPAPTNLAGRVTTLTTGRDALTIPRVVYTTDNLYTSGMRVTWTGEIPASASAHRVTEPSFGQVRVPIYTAMMSLPLTNDMVEDASYNIVGWCTSKFGETIDLLKDNMIVNGTGVTQPSGILINAQFISNDVHSGAAGALTWDGILNLLFALPEQYDQGSAVYMNKTNTALALAKLQDGEGRPYWGVGTQDSGLSGQRINKDLLGYPVVFNAFMPNTTANLYPIIFGDLRGYYLVNRVGMSIQVLRELYSETNQILLLGRIRFGGELVEDWRIRGQVAAA